MERPDFCMILRPAAQEVTPKPPWGTISSPLTPHRLPCGGLLSCHGLLVIINSGCRTPVPLGLSDDFRGHECGWAVSRVCTSVLSVAQLFPFRTTCGDSWEVVGQFFTVVILFGSGDSKYGVPVLLRLEHTARILCVEDAGQSFWVQLSGAPSSCQGSSSRFGRTKYLPGTVPSPTQKKSSWGRCPWRPKGWTHSQGSISSRSPGGSRLSAAHQAAGYDAF